MTERTKQSLRLEGIDPEKMEKIATESFAKFSDLGLSIKETEVVIHVLGCILKNVKERSPSTFLNTIPIQDYGLNNLQKIDQEDCSESTLGNGACYTFKQN